MERSNTLGAISNTSDSILWSSHAGEWYGIIDELNPSYSLPFNCVEGIKHRRENIQAYTLRRKTLYTRKAASYIKLSSKFVNALKKTANAPTGTSKWGYRHAHVEELRHSTKPTRYHRRILSRKSSKIHVPKKSSQHPHYSFPSHSLPLLPFQVMRAH